MDSKKKETPSKGTGGAPSTPTQTQNKRPISTPNTPKTPSSTTPSSSMKKKKKTEQQQTKKGDSRKLNPDQIKWAKVPKETSKKMEELFAPHVESFNFFLDEGLPLAVSDLIPSEVKVNDNTRMSFWVDEVQIAYPSKDTPDDKLFPWEARAAGTSYSSQMFARVYRRINDGPVETFQKAIGRLPIMIKSSRCRLHGFSPKELVEQHEEAGEMGGYFIVNGIEKLIRLLVVQRRSYPMALIRNAFTKRGSSYSNFGVTIRCVRPDQTSLGNTLHYLTNGTCNLRFQLNRQEYFIPVPILLKAFVETTDREIFERIVQGNYENTFLTERVELMLRETKHHGLHTREQNLAFLGQRFRVSLGLPDRMTDKEVGDFMIQKFVLVHQSAYASKYDLLVFMVQKLYALVSGEIVEDNPDSPQNQEILLGGHLYLMVLKEKIQEWLNSLKYVLMKDINSGMETTGLLDPNHFKKSMDKLPDLGKKMSYFLATGNLQSSTGLDLMQTSGYCVIAEKLNFFRYLSHFRCVHRGQFFTTLKTTSVRKLLPEAWGFLCPVHTPDGAPCGLLNHLAAQCKVITETLDTTPIPSALASLGMNPSAGTSLSTSSAVVSATSSLYTVLLDGRVVGTVDSEYAVAFVKRVRHLKALSAAAVEEEEKNSTNGNGAHSTGPVGGIPRHLEIAFVPRLPSGQKGGQHPGIYIYTTPGRMMRPVKQLSTGLTEFIGSFEQIYMDIACLEEDIKAGLTTHIELKPTNMLSVVASLTPFSDFNQSPRNMYQCQMGKQTMGTPCHSFTYRTDNKMYRIQNPQRPAVRTVAQNEFEMDDFPSGTNAVVAVISYTGFDMEDAMIINKSSYERGFGHGSLYKNEIIDLVEEKKATMTLGNRMQRYFCNTVSDSGSKFDEGLDEDGLPHPGQYLTEGVPYYCIFDESTGAHVIKKFKSKEPAWVDDVKIVGLGDNNSKGQGRITKASIKLRFRRNPVIGDKFSSRHGQKGVLSILWPNVDMPFSESGMCPDVIINPHAFPSRMTIGMLVESLAGKSACLHGAYQDATPFQFDENNTAVEHFGDQLLKAGYNYHGNEVMFSGITGQQFNADIYLGVVFYQRLRHMVSDKYQVRSIGAVHNLTRQPIKGRKVGGGIRFGEMERDSLLAHGASFLLHDRLMNCSDYTKSVVCEKCGSLITTKVEPSTVTSRRKIMCTLCNSDKNIRIVAIPFVFRYLAAELGAMNIRMFLEVK